MTRVIDRAKAHYSGLGRKSVKVPEWGEPGKPFVIYASPMTVAHRDRIRECGHADQAEMFVDVLILKAQDEQGDMMFTEADRHDLTRKVDSRVVARIALEILAGPSDEDLEKN